MKAVAAFTVGCVAMKETSVTAKLTMKKKNRKSETKINLTLALIISLLFIPIQPIVLWACVINFLIVYAHLSSYSCYQVTGILVTCEPEAF